METPPTQFLPYPPPANYQWPPGQGPRDQNPQPSEFDPPPGVYGGYNPNSNGNGNAGSSSSSNPGMQPPGSNGGGGGPQFGPGHLAWIIVVTIIGSALVFGLLGFWYKGMRMAKVDAGGDGEGGEKKKLDVGAMMGKMKFWGKGGKKEGRPPPAAAAAAAAADDARDDE